MGSFRLGRSHRGLGVFVSEHMFLNISLVGCRGKLAVLAFLMGLVGRHFFKVNPRLGILNKYIGNLRLFIDTSLSVLCEILLKKANKICV